jgi:hypothetical protein
MRVRDYLAGYITCYSADYAQRLPLKGSSKRQSCPECWLESVFRILITRHASCGGPNSHLGAGLGGRGVSNTTIALVDWDGDADRRRIQLRIKPPKAPRITLRLTRLKRVAQATGSRKRA